jgi:predicted dehydrogenase
MVTIPERALTTERLAAADRPADARRIRVGVVGVGYWGPKVIRNFAALPEAELVAVCDRVPERLAAVAAQYPGVHVTPSYAELLATDIEAVSIVTPLGTHYELVKRALCAGKHVLVEKPLAATVRQATELVALAQEHDRVLMVGHTFLFEPAVEALGALVRGGELGEIRHITAQRLNLGLVLQDANALWDLAPHDVAILLDVLGELPEAVSAQGAAFLHPGVHDVVHVDLWFPGGRLAHLHLSRLDPVKVRRMTVAGSQKMAVYDDLAPDKLVVHDCGVVLTSNSEGRLEALYRLGEAQPQPLPRTDEPLRRQCAYFVDCVRRGVQPQPDGRLGLTVVRILEQANRSLHNHGRRERLYWDGADSELWRRGGRLAARHEPPARSGVRVREAAG